MIARRILGFLRFLREMGFKSAQSHLLNAMEAICITGLERALFRDALRCTLCSNQWEWSMFDGLFEAFFKGDLGAGKATQEKERPPSKKGAEEVKAQESENKGFLKEVDPGLQGQTEVSVSPGLGYSPVSVVLKKDLQGYLSWDIQCAQLAIRHIMAPFRIQETRRYRPGKGNRVDQKATFKEALKHQGWPLRLYFQTRKRRLKRLLIVADVSGSMQRYNAMVIPFLLGLKGIGPRAEVFVFSTRVKRITEIIRHLPLDKALWRMVGETPDWSGGTRIGESLARINRDYTKRLLTKRTVVIIISDGWDLGAKAMLLKEIRHMRQHVNRIVWLNPIAGDPDLQIMSQAVRLCMPYIDHHIPAATLMDLVKVGSILRKIMAP